ncbi:MAG: twin transmembrane helix small protein [Nitrosomonadales bacterium]
MASQIIFKYFVIILLIIVILSLTSGLNFLIREKKQSNRMVKSLTIRISLSVFLFFTILFGYKLGLIVPNH